MNAMEPLVSIVSNRDCGGVRCGSGLGTVAAHSGANGSRPGSRSVSSHLNNFFDLHDNSLLSEDPEGNMVRSLHFTHLSRIYQKSPQVSRGSRETRLRPDAHDDAPRAPCRTRGHHHGSHLAFVSNEATPRRCHAGRRSHMASAPCR